MATLTRTAMTHRFSSRGERAGSTVPSGKSAFPGQLVFIVGSMAVHAGLLTFVSSAPSSAHAAVTPTDISVDLVELPLPISAVVEKPTPMPLGQLHAPRLSSSRPTPEVAPREQVPAPTQNTLADAHPPEEPTALNPYASSDAAAFTSGAASTRTIKRLPVVGLSAHPSFGVKNGTADASEEAKKRLMAWHNQVRSKLATIGSRSYPRRAQKLGLQGTTKVTVSIGASGTIVGVSVSNSSGHPTLDRSALSNLRSIGSVAAPPAGTGATKVTFPVTFRLR